MVSLRNGGDSKSEKNIRRVDMAKNLIIYYSKTGQNYVNGSVKTLTKGNTEYCAEFIQKAVGGDLFQIETVKEYAADYYACIDEAKAELRMKDRPALKNYLDNIADYDNVFICGPCWWRSSTGRARKSWLS